mgnify:FL=1
MKYANFFLKVICMAVIAFIFYHYQEIAVTRAAIVAENEAAIAEVEEYNLEIQKENAKRAAAAQEVIYYYKDGTYEGTGQGYGGPITVSVTIEYDLLTDVHVLSHEKEDPAYFDLAEPLVNKVMSAQSLDVDTVSGATFSSKGILEAINNALETAVAE